MQRDEILRTAEDCIARNRQDAYGPPEDSFAEIAAAWNWWLGERISDEIDAFDVAQMMSLLKKARAKASPHHADNFVDDAGYTALAGEMGTRPPAPPEPVRLDVRALHFGESSSLPGDVDNCRF